MRVRHSDDSIVTHNFRLRARSWPYYEPRATRQARTPGVTMRATVDRRSIHPAGWSSDLQTEAALEGDTRDAGRL